MKLNINKRCVCVNCKSSNTYIDGGTQNSDTNNCFVIICEDCNHENFLKTEQSMEYGKSEFENFMKLITFKKFNIANLKMLADNGFEGFVYYEEESGGHQTFDCDKMDSKYNDMKISSIHLYGGWITISIDGCEGTPLFELREN